MNKYYFKLINRKLLINFWLFFGNNLKIIFKINFKYISCFYKRNLLINWNSCILFVKKIFPLIISILKKKGIFLLVGSKHIYCQSLSFNCKHLVRLSGSNRGLISNFSYTGYQLFKNLILNVCPIFIIFFHLQRINYLIFEAKKKNIPIFALNNGENNSLLIDYYLALNCSYFYNIYIFSQFLFKIILRLI